jgi:hypothetical protein
MRLPSPGDQPQGIRDQSVSTEGPKAELENRNSQTRSVRTEDPKAASPRNWNSHVGMNRLDDRIPR